MPFDAQGYWYPGMCEKQIPIYNSYSRYTLVSGPKKSGKTLINLHRLVRHAVEIPKARVGMFTKTIRNAKSGGVWNDLIDIILPEWTENGQTSITTKRSDGTMGPKQDAQTRMMYIRLKDCQGTESEIQLHSIDNENEVESIAKGTRFSMFYFSELSNFRNRLVFDITTDQLRMPGLPFEDHMWLADTNPADDGEDSWIWRLWYWTFIKPEKNPSDLQLLKHLKLFELMIPDNLFLSPEEVADLEARFAHDKDLYDRYIKGMWVRASKEALFAENFINDVHVIGDNHSLEPNDWDIILPSEHCFQLLSGWDLGDKFHSAHIIEPVESETEGRIYCVIDEVTHLDTDNPIGISEFVESFMEAYRLWTNFVTKNDRSLVDAFEWRHWSDRAALTNYRSGAETYDKNLVYKYSDGDIELLGAPKFSGSIGKRINLLKILLFEKRLLVSAKCIRTIEMFKSLRKGTGALLIAKNQIYRHVFDSLSYALAGEEPALLMQELSEGNVQEKGELLSVRL